MVAAMDESRILLAEDNEGDVFLAKLALQDHGLNCEVVVVSDGEAALSIVEKIEGDANTPNVALLLLDLHLPKRDGLEVLRQLRAGKRGAKVPVLILTSSDCPDDRKSAERFDHVHFFRKPSSLDEFLALGRIARNLMESRVEKASVARIAAA